MNISDKAKEAARLELQESYHPGKHVQELLDARDAEIARLNGLLKLSCRDWAEDDTAIKKIASKFGIREDDIPDEFKSAVTVVEELATKLEQATVQLAAAKEALQRCRDVLVVLFDDVHNRIRSDISGSIELRAIDAALSAPSPSADQLSEDKDRLDWLEQATINERSDCRYQFHKMTCGPLTSELTITMYDGRTTHDYSSTSIREAIDQARRQQQ